jgi:ABC-type methionine transport system ATPase subunit
MGSRYHLTFPEHLLQEPVIYRLGREFDVVTNIRRASIEDRLGWAILDLDGAEGAVEAAVGWLIENGIEVERIEEEAPRP